MINLMYMFNIFIYFDQDVVWGAAYEVDDKLLAEGSALNTREKSYQERRQEIVYTKGSTIIFCICYLPPAHQVRFMRSKLTWGRHRFCVPSMLSSNFIRVRKRVLLCMERNLSVFPEAVWFGSEC